MLDSLPRENEQLLRKYKHAITLIKRSLELYGPSSLAFSFNGGKDSTLLLHLLLQACKEWRAVRPGAATANSGANGAGHGLAGVHVFFFVRPDEFPEVLQFVRDTDAAHCLDTQFYTCDFKAGLQQMLSERPIKGIFLGTRHGDPNCGGQEFFCPSSDDWPVFMRINPILNWTYGDVWACLRAAGLAHCSLYDQGYTSLGSVKNTAPNNALLRPDGTYAPAHQLSDDRLERAGRIEQAGAKRGAKRTRSRQAQLAHTAGLVIVGDEILSGKVVDSNTPFLASQLHGLGWRLLKVAIVPDSVDAIAREVEVLRAVCEVVITSGGVGPTADDCTVEAVAAAVGTRVTQHAGLADSLRGYFGDQLLESHLKMAQTPEGHTELLYHAQPDGHECPWPLLKVGNVFVLPGVPALCRQKWAPLQEHLQAEYGASSAPYHNRVVQLKLRDEGKVAAAFEALSAEFPDLAVGSYPKHSDVHGPLVLISLEAKDEAHVELAVERFRVLLDEADDPDLHADVCIVAVDSDVSILAGS